MDVSKDVVCAKKYQSFCYTWPIIRKTRKGRRLIFLELDLHRYTKLLNYNDRKGHGFEKKIELQIFAAESCSVETEWRTK